MLLADLMVSSDSQSTSPAQIPTSNDISSVLEACSTSVPFGMRQKLAVISSSLVIGWSGNQRIAQMVLSDIMARERQTRFERESLQKYFNSLNQEIWKQIGLMGFLEDSEGISTFQCDRTVLCTHDVLGNIALLGSGAGDARRAIYTNFASLKTLDGTPGDVDFSIGFGLQLTGTLLTLEIATLQSLESMYGAGYELITLIDQSFQKLDDIAYLFWDVRLRNSSIELLKFPVRVFRYAYHGDILTIRSARFSDSGGKINCRQDLFSVPPAYRDPPSTEFQRITPPSLNAQIICNYFLITENSLIKGILALVTRRDSSEDRRWVWFEERDGTVGGEVDQTFVSFVERELALGATTRP